MDFIVLIPARYASTRFPGKPLQMLGQKSVIEHTYRRAAEAAGEKNVWVATDSEAIAEHVALFGGQTVMVTEPVRSGTLRCAAAIRQLGITPHAVVNVQGDEPFVDPADIRRLARAVASGHSEIATLVRRFDPKLGFDALFDPNTPKVTFDARGFALYFSRSIIPYVRNYPWQDWLDHAEFHTHIGTYAFTPDALCRVSALPPSPAEEAESLEQLGWLHAGERILTVISQSRHTIGIDTPDDLDLARRYLKTLDAR